MTIQWKRIEVEMIVMVTRLFMFCCLFGLVSFDTSMAQSPNTDFELIRKNVNGHPSDFFGTGAELDVKWKMHNSVPGTFMFAWKIELISGTGFVIDTVTGVGTVNVSAINTEECDCIGYGSSEYPTITAKITTYCEYFPGTWDEVASDATSFYWLPG